MGGLIMSLEIEHRVLGTLMMMDGYKDLIIQESLHELEPDFFNNNESRQLFNIIIRQFKESKSFDLETMALLVPYELTMLVYEACGKSWSTGLILNDVKFLKESYRRKLISARLSTLVKEFKNESIPDVACELAVNACTDIAKLGLVDERHVFTSDLNAENYLSAKGIQSPTLTSGIKTIDDLTGGGFKNRSLITIAGRSGMGKTSFGVYLAHNIAAKSKNPHVLFYSLEMAANDIYEKQLSCIAKQQIANAPRDKQLNAVSSSLEVPFTIHSKPLVSIDYIETSARLTHVKTPFSVIVVDYLGIVQNKAKLETHVLKQADIALRLSALACELNCIVIALTQVNRDYALRKDKVPITADAADSSGSERSSSYWLGIYRPYIDDETACENDFVVKCRKSRFGNAWNAYFLFNQGTFGEVDQRLFTARAMSPKRDIDKYLNKG
jgi:replicative DNA helicase